MEIIDGRSSNDFKLTTISNYQKSAVKSAFIDNLGKCNIEGSCYWAAELICSGLFIDVWDILIFYYTKFIHIGNPKLPIYFEIRFNTFKQISNLSEELDDIALRNNITIRKLFTELVTILCLSKKKNSYDEIVIKDTEFVMNNLTEKLKAPSIEYIRCFKMKDPKELFIPLNELCYHLTLKNTTMCYYWIEWVMYFEIFCKKKKEKCLAIERDYPVQLKYKKDIIWIIWDILFDFIDENNALMIKIFNSLISMFTIAYTSSNKKKRKYILYYAITLLCDDIKLDIPIISNKTIVDEIVEKYDQVYKDIKKNLPINQSTNNK